MAKFTLGKKTPSLRTPKGAVLEGPDKSGLKVWSKDGRQVKWEHTVAAKKGERGPGYRKAKVADGMDKGHVFAVKEGAKKTPLADSPKNIIGQTPRTNRSNIKRFEAWRAEHAKGCTVTTAQPNKDGLVRVQVKESNGTVRCDTTYDPNSTNRFPDGWWNSPGPHR